MTAMWGGLGVLVVILLSYIPFLLSAQMRAIAVQWEPTLKRDAEIPLVVRLKHRWLQGRAVLSALAMLGFLLPYLYLLLWRCGLLR